MDLGLFMARSFKRPLSEASVMITGETMRYTGLARDMAVSRMTSGLIREFLGLQITVSAQKS
jgi:hypothetical protein